MASPIVRPVAATRGTASLSRCDAPNERIRSMLDKVRGPDILHVGCVNHRLPTTPREQAQSIHYQLCVNFSCARILGIDTDRPNVERMKALGFDVEIGDAQNLAFRSCFDTIIAGELIEHLSNPGLFLDGAVRALKPGGTLVLSTPNVFSAMLNLMYLKNYDRAFNSEHALWFCPQTLRELLHRHDLEAAQFEFVDDLEPALVSSHLYRTFANIWRGIRFFFPARYRNTMIVVCRPK